MANKMRIAVLASGSGTNLQSILERQRQGQLDVEIALVISNNPEAKALQRAAQAGLATRSINHRNFNSRAEFDQAVVAELTSAEVELVVLAGFMRILSDVFLRAYPQRIINIHPALLPAFPGTDGYGDTFRYGCKVGGCTVHFIDYGEDTGPIIGQKAFEIADTDTLDDVKRKGLEKEWELYPACIQKFADGVLS